MFTDMFNAIENKTEPLETFYDGYIVNAIIDACYASAKSKKWEPVQIESWRGDQTDEYGSNFTSYDDDHYLIKTEILPNGEHKLILKHKVTGEVTAKNI
jgi:hypothetical protein